jgi:excisionase family DNA binding protein
MVETPREPRRFLTVEDVARLLNVSAKTVQDWRYRGLGPPAVKVGRAVRFDADDLEAWIRSRHED